ncbi:MAG: filamentous hemagglutinin N-terminal domain-containing protein, partial [Cyanobacteria bacterium P01_F01_bin.153]
MSFPRRLTVPFTPHAAARAIAFSPLSLSAINGILFSAPAIAQNITSAPDELSTQVQQQENLFTITGGQTSGDGASLFHSFGEFNLDQGQTAQFVTPATTQSVLGRVVGGNPSLIDGTVQLVGSSADLYLLNPAGMVFGQNAALDVPGVFLGSTATGIGYEDAVGNVQWFDVSGPATPQNFAGGPSLLRFEVEAPAAIANFGNLAVGDGEQIWLVGGNVLNAGSLTARTGTIVMTAVEGNQRARFAPVVPFSLFAVPIGTSLRTITPPSEISAATPTAITPQDLPTLLTGAEGIYPADLVTVTDQGQVLLQGGATPNTPVDTTPGVATVSGIVDISSGDISSFLFGTTVTTGRQVNVVGANIDSRGPFTAGFVSFGGGADRQGPGGLPTTQVTVDSATSINASAILQGNGSVIAVRSTGTAQFAGQAIAQGGAVGGDGGFFAFDDEPAPTAIIDLSAPNGRPGTVIESDSALGDELRATLGELLTVFESLSTFSEFNPLFESALSSVDIRNPEALAAFISTIDISGLGTEFTAAAGQASSTFDRLGGALDEAFGSVNAFRVRNNRSGNVDLQSLTALRGSVLSAAVDTNPTRARQDLSDRLDSLTASEMVGNLEQLRAAEYGNHWGVTYQVPVVESSVDSMQTVLQAIAQNPGKTATVIYAFIHDDDLELTLVLPNGTPKRHRFKGIVPSLLAANLELRWHIANPLQESPGAYQTPAQDLYQWLLAPFRDTLDQRNVELLLFSLDSGLRSLPLAALHDGKQYLIENYAVATIPSFGLLETQYQPLTDAKVLVAGASRFDALDD